MKTKTCSACSKEKPLSEFGLAHERKDGHRGICKLCRNEQARQWCKENPGKSAEYCHRSRQKHLKERRAKGRARYHIHKNEWAEQRCQYRQENLEKVRLRDREYYQRTRTQQLENARYYRERQRSTPEGRAAHVEEIRQWRRKYPDKARAKARQDKLRRRAIMAGAEGYHTEEAWQAISDRHDARCLRCGSTEDLTRDHIIPLSNGGSDYASNLQPLCRSCNASKGKRYIDYRPQAYWRDWT